MDAEPDIIEVARGKPEASGVRLVISSAETLDAPAITSSRPSSAVLSTGWTGMWPPPGSVAGSAVLDQWKTALGAEHRIPAGWEEARSRRPDSTVLSEAGFELAGRYEFAVKHRWTLPGLAGLIRSTSFLPAAVLGDQAGAFDANLEAVSFNYERARKPS